MKRIIDDIINQISPVKRFRSSVTCLLDLPNEILLMICRYLSIYDVLHCFYTPEKPNSYLHCWVHDYYKKINLSLMTLVKCDYVFNLFYHSDNLLRPKLLILSNEYRFSSNGHYFFHLPDNIIQSVLLQLTHLTLINCTSTDLHSIKKYYKDSTKLECLYVINPKRDTNIDKCDQLFNELLFTGQMCTLHTVTLESLNGLSLYRYLKPHQGLRHFNIILQTIDDLYILLNGLVPNIETLMVQLRQSRLSIPWPSNRQDQRKVPIINGKYNISVTSDVKYTHYINHVNITTNDEMLKINEKFNRVRELTTCLSIDRKLPRHITRLILTISSMMSTSQEHICHLIVERRLTDENEIQKLAHQFPNVEYLELLFPFGKIIISSLFSNSFSFCR
ncbi:unnamed protein product [Rotaria sp. Silwood2]|nr:unnamed protein product [Rotaria sp. Silwood2]CAF4603719.1 unnamed protein product [Rotaria sp. Silwood2]